MTLHSDKRPVVVMAGGTGGHVIPALSVAKALQEEGLPVVWLGTKAGLEARLVPEAGIPIRWITISGVRGKGKLTLLLAPFKLLRAVFQAARHLRAVKPQAVIGMGGFASGPGGLAAWLLRKPLMIQEQNAVAGMTNTQLTRFARKVAEGFPNSFKRKVNTVVTGNPVRSDIVAIPAPEQRLAGRDQEHLRVLVVGGSLGAVALNRMVPQALAQLAKQGELAIDVRHQVGRKNAQQTAAFYASVEHPENLAAADQYVEQAQHLEMSSDEWSDTVLAAASADTVNTIGYDVQLMPYIDDMAEAYTWADLVVCRAGALTVAEVAAAGVAALFIPFPGAVDDHQTVNAQFLENAGAAKIVQQRDLNADSLAALLADLLSDRDNLLAMSVAARGVAITDATARLKAMCLSLGEKN